MDYLEFAAGSEVGPLLVWVSGREKWNAGQWECFLMSDCVCVCMHV